MELNEIKKELYKQKPIAYFQLIRKGKAHYSSVVDNTSIYFEVPVNDMGDADLLREMDAKLLIRYLVPLTKTNQ